MPKNTSEKDETGRAVHAFSQLDPDSVSWEEAEWLGTYLDARILQGQELSHEQSLFEERKDFKTRFEEVLADSIQEEDKSE